MKIALVGNQNSGKTTLFNALTGNNQKVGNWPGVTIERKEGHVKDTDIVIVDLPGVYSLSPYTSEEEVSRSFVLNSNPDLIINIVDATSIERSLYLTTQLLETDHDVIIKLFEGISLEGTYVPEKTKVNNLTGKEIKVASKIKPKVNITRSFCDKLNAAVNV